MSYKEDESPSEASDASEAEESQDIKPKETDENTQTIEKIIDSRVGKKGGMLSV